MKYPVVCCDFCGRDTTNKSRICKKCAGGRLTKDESEQDGGCQKPFLFSELQLSEINLDYIACDLDSSIQYHGESLTDDM